MAFIVEDGTGLPDANSYVSLEFCDNYLEERNYKVWFEETTEHERMALLIQATDYIEVRFGPLFLGCKMYSDSSLSFPRKGIPGYDDGVIPLCLEKATCEYSLRAISGNLLPDPVIDETGWAVKSYKDKVDVLEEQKTFSIGDGVNQFLIRPYPYADLLLASLIRGMCQGRVIRA